MHKIRYLAVLGLLAAAGAIAACKSGPSEEDLTALKTQLQSEQQKSAALQEQLSAKEAEAATTAKEGAGTFELLTGQAAPTALPPTPPPTGYVTPTREAPPAFLYEPVNDYIVYAETLATTRVSKYGFAATRSCTQNGVFKRGMRIVWRFEVFDPKTDKRITDKDTGTTVTVVLPNGDVLKPRFSQRGGGRVPGAPFMWSTSWDIPLDYPLGGLDYVISVEKEGGTAFKWHVPAVVAEHEDSRLQIIE